MTRFSRRQMILGGAALGGAALGASLPAALAAPQPAPLTLRTRMTSFAFGDRPETQGLISLADHAPPSVLRLRRDQEAVIDFTNGLEEYTTLHWHGIRLENAMDGVPYLTQFPMVQGETFRYRFTPPDAGTFWYHPHCMTMDQMALGLTGALIVEAPDEPQFDADIVLNLKDFHLNDDGTLRPHFTPRGAARAGTSGNVKATNWQSDPLYDVPAGGLIRLRILVTDTTRIHRLVFPGITGRIIAWDGHPVDAPVPWPTAEAPLMLAPGQRVDLAILAPATEGQELALNSLSGSGQPFNIARLRAVGAPLSRRMEDLAPLPGHAFRPADLDTAPLHEVVFGWSPEGDGTNNGFCGSYDYVFWSINHTPWPGDAVENVGPVLHLDYGKSYVLRLRNESPNMHPIHLHGLVMKPIRSNLRQIPANYTDTFLLMKDEIVDMAVRADNPGDWAFHCHVIEHQKTGLSGYISVG